MSILVGALVDPLVLGGAAVITLVLVSGAAARVVELAQAHRPRGEARRSSPLMAGRPRLTRS